jgi:hypothetical protein
MEQYVGLDVSLKETSLCVVDQTGTTLWQGKCDAPELEKRVPHQESTGSDPDRPRERAAVDLVLARAQSVGSAGRLSGCASCQGGLIVAAQQDGCQ